MADLTKEDAANRAALDKRELATALTDAADKLRVTTEMSLRKMIRSMVLVTVVGTIPACIGAWAAGRGAWISWKVGGKVDESIHQMNSIREEMVSSARTSGRAEGVIEGKAGRNNKDAK